jgi:hypothetical protein
MIKSKIVFSALGVLMCFAANAQNGSGYYQTLRYRSNDPFVFCHYGLINWHGWTQSNLCWYPLPPYTGANWQSPLCYYNPGPGTCTCVPGSYGCPCRYDTSEETDSFKQYGQVCPKAIQSGEWQGKGNPMSIPFQH